MKAWIALLAVITLASPACADVVWLPPQRYVDDEEIGEIELLREVLAPLDAECDDAGLPPCPLGEIYAAWEPQSAPVQIRVRRDRTGYAIQLLSMVMNRKDSPLCVSDLPLDGVATRSPGKLWAELRSAVEAWAPNCAPLRTIGVGPILADFARRERDFRTAFSRMAAVPANRLSEAEEGTSTGTYFPTQVTQGLLDAVADACEAPRERLRLRSDGSIDWRPGQSMPYGTSGARPVDGCVELQIGHFPGYPRRS